MPKKFKAVIVAAMVISFIIPQTAFAAEGRKYPTGYIPERIDYSHLKNNPPVLNRNSGYVKATPIPASYDLRDYGYLSSVRDQNPFGTCWAHAAIGAMESSYLKQGLTGLGTSKDINLSELHLAWFAPTLRQLSRLRTRQKESWSRAEMQVLRQRSCRA